MSNHDESQRAESAIEIGTEAASTVAAARSGDTAAAMSSGVSAGTGAARAAGVDEGAAHTAIAAAQSGVAIAQQVRSGDTAGAIANGAGAAAGLVGVVSGNADVARAAGYVETAAALARTVVTAAQSIARSSASNASSDGSGAQSGGARPLGRPHFTFVCDPVDTHWSVLRFDLEETLSEPYTCRLELVCDAIDCDPHALLGHPCTLTIERDDALRKLHGIVDDVEDTGARGEHGTCSVTVRPALAMLGMGSDSYVFQNQTVPQIVSVILSERLAEYGRTFRSTLQRDYVEREYVVQFEESDLAFVTRLLADEGIGYFFDQSGDDEELVLFDLNEALPLHSTSDGEPVPVRGAESDVAATESVRHLFARQRQRTTTVTTRDRDWSRPALDLTRASRGQDERGREREEYVFPGAHIESYKGSAYSHDDARLQAELRRQRHGVERGMSFATTNVTALQAGSTFEVAGHTREHCNRRWMAVRVKHHGHAPEALPSDVHDHATVTPHERYGNEAVVMAADVPFVPPRPERRRVGGIHLATVVGPTGEEVHTDEHGRVKVQFAWDRAGQNDERSSCWVRVKQGWSGAGWGTFFLPRVGMEVAVEFVDGDPDRPLVTGCVYNGTHPPPVALPEHSSRSTIKTRSTPNHDGGNELRFEDAAGNEELYLHAQKDLNERVRNDHGVQVDRDESMTIRRNQTENIGGDVTLAIMGNRTATIRKNDRERVQGDRVLQVTGTEKRLVSGDRTDRVVGDAHYEVAGKRTQTIGGLETQTFQNDKLVSVAGNDRLVVQHDRTEVTHGSSDLVTDVRHTLRQGSTTMEFTQGHVELNAASFIHLDRSNASLHMDEDGKVTIMANAQLTLQCGAASITLKPDGTVTISGSASASLLSGGSTVKVEPSGATVSGTTISSTAIGLHEISGALVKVG